MVRIPFLCFDFFVVLFFFKSLCTISIYVNNMVRIPWILEGARVIERKEISSPFSFFVYIFSAREKRKS